ncbi:GNAT family N-acetyltransferase [Angustibacter sp. McL0619]|uniref:GNAT family N-acetyltransferase n=1 Tax=Angustibacter sp. McL0619 TaxID=3415676 RepID=UPI003CF5E1A3
MSGQPAALTSKFPVTTPRLRLRLFEERDLDMLFEIQSDPGLVRYVPFGPRRLEEVRDALDQRLASPPMDADEQVLRLVAERLDDGEFVGELTLFLHSVANRQGEFGFMMRRSQQRQGFGSEAAKAVLGLGFDWLGLHRMIGQCDPANDASSALMRGLGMRQEAHLREFEIFKGEWGDLLVFAMLEDEWHAAVTGASEPPAATAG